MRSLRPSGGPGSPTKDARVGPTHPRQVLADMLGVAIGADVARAAVHTAAIQLGLSDLLTRQEALRVLEHVANESGVLGIAARFAKSRVHLVWGTDTSSGG